MIIDSKNYVTQRTQSSLQTLVSETYVPFAAIKMVLWKNYITIL